MNREIIAEQPPIRMKQCRNGLLMYNMNDQYIGRSLDVYGEFSELEFDLFRHILKPGMTVMDIGANIGVHTVSIAKAVGPEGRVIAIEPQRIIYQMMCGNLALNNITNTLPMMLAVGKQDGQAGLPHIDYTKTANFGGVSLYSNAAGETVQMITIDALNMPDCNFIKMDIEGMELDAFQGAVQTLKRCNPIIYVENDRRDRSEALIRFLLSTGYRLYWHLPPLFNAKNYYGVTEDIFPSLVSVNMLGLPAAMMGAELKTLPEITAENAHIHPHQDRT